jgi:hypothetical protein
MRSHSVNILLVYQKDGVVTKNDLRVRLNARRFPSCELYGIFFRLPDLEECTKLWWHLESQRRGTVVLGCGAV